MTCGTTHHPGCECHEAAWAAKLAARESDWKAENDALNVLRSAHRLILADNARLREAIETDHKVGHDTSDGRCEWDVCRVLRESGEDKET